MNRAFHLDEVLVKLISWVDWIRANPKETENIDFEEH